MNVLHTDFHRGWGGQAARVLMVCRELQKAGHLMKIAAPPGELTRRAREAGLPVDDGFAFRPPARALSFLADVRRLVRILKADRIDILHTHGSQDTWVGAAARVVLSDAPLFVATRHNTKPVRYNAPNRYLYGRVVDHLIIVSESVRERFRPFIETGRLQESRISVVHSAYRVELFRDDVGPGTLREDLGLGGRGPILGVLARLVKDKGHTYLFQAMDGIRRIHPGVVLLVAGLGPHEAALREEVAARGLGDAVRFLGFRDDAAEITALMDVAVLPSVGCDASSASIKEAMAMARPLVASDVGGAREILEDGVTGLVVPPADPAALSRAVLTLLDDPGRARAMGEAARRAVRSRFGPEILAQGTLAVYERLLAERGGVRAAVTAPVAGSGGGRP